MVDDLFRLDNKIIVITGATGRLGRKHAQSVAAYGGTPILLDLSQKKINTFADELNSKYNVNSLGFELNITNENSIKTNSEWLLNKFGKIDGLVNNAANNPKVEDTEKVNFSRLENFPLNIWHDDISIGLTGAFLCAKYYGAAISKNPNGGVIINIASDLGLISPDQRIYKKDGVLDELQNVKPVTYSVVKAGLIGLTRYLATYWPEKNVRCNAMCPGGVKNDRLSEEFIKTLSERIPMGRLAESNEYQSTLLWMLSDSSSYLNGAIIPIDGGRTSW